MSSDAFPLWLPNPLKRSLRTRKLPIKPVRRHPPPSCGLLERRAPRKGGRIIRLLISGVRAPPLGLPVNQGNYPVQFSSAAQSCLTLCDPVNCSTPGLPVHHQLPEFTHTHVHRVGDAIQPSHPLSSPSPPAFTLSQHRVFSNESVLHIRWPKYWSFSFSISPSNEYSGLISFWMDWLDLLAVQGSLKSLL